MFCCHLDVWFKKACLPIRLVVAILKPVDHLLTASRNTVFLINWAVFKCEGEMCMPDSTPVDLFALRCLYCYFVHIALAFNSLNLSLTIQFLLWSNQPSRLTLHHFNRHLLITDCSTDWVCGTWLQLIIH